MGSLSRYLMEKNGSVRKQVIALSKTLTRTVARP
jgi:hypothetical protein